MTDVQECRQGCGPGVGTLEFPPCPPFGKGAERAEAGQGEMCGTDGYLPFGKLLRAMYAASEDLGHPVHYTTSHCERLNRLLLKAQHIVRESIAFLDGTGGHASPWWQALLLLRPLHRIIQEAQVLVRNVAGLLARGRIHKDRTDSYNHLREKIKRIRQACQVLYKPFADAIPIGQDSPQQCCTAMAS